MTTTGAMKFRLTDVPISHIGPPLLQPCSLSGGSPSFGHLLADVGYLRAHLEHDLLDAAPDRKITSRRAALRQARQCRQGDTGNAVFSASTSARHSAVPPKSHCRAYRTHSRYRIGPVLLPPTAHDKSQPKVDQIRAATNLDCQIWLRRRDEERVDTEISANSPKNTERKAQRWPMSGVASLRYLNPANHQKVWPWHHKSYQPYRCYREM